MIEMYKDDISTIFSIVPFYVREFKPGLYPGSFNIDPCLDDSRPEILKVGASEHLMFISGRKEAQRILTPSYQIANSIVTDFFDGQLWTTPDERPGICWLQGNIDHKTFVLAHKQLYEKIKDQQRKWFVRICKQTDNEWKKQQSYRVVSDQARFAAQFLGLDPEWMRAEEVGLTFVKCPACNIMNDPQSVVCSGCSALLTPELLAAKTKEEKLKVLKFARAS